MGNVIGLFEGTPPQVRILERTRQQHCDLLAMRQALAQLPYRLLHLVEVSMLFCVSRIGRSMTAQDVFGEHELNVAAAACTEALRGRCEKNAPSPTAEPLPTMAKRKRSFSSS